MAKVNFWNQAKSFMWESYLSQLFGNAQREPENEGTLFREQ